MSLTKDIWMDEVERIQEEYIAGKLTVVEAGRKLVRMGFDSEEADSLLEDLVN